jgi:DNA-(apurinic or apyrimidinic site) lyase
MSEKLLEILKKYSLGDIIEIEESDRQFLALKRLHGNMKNKGYFLPLIVTNALLSYQLSSIGEEYWEEFADHASSWNF